MHDIQLNLQGNLRHLITLSGLGCERILSILDRAVELRSRFKAGIRQLPLLQDRTVMNLFFEPSTRTRISFELAARRLGAQVINFDNNSASTSKGESLEDTLHTLEAMECDAFVVRHQQAGIPAQLAKKLQTNACILNAGDGHHAHPTQGLLDMLTIRDHKTAFENLSVVICGDIVHSRVARSDIHALHILGVKEIRLCAPSGLLPRTEPLPHCQMFEDFDAALSDADVIIMLRLQKERMHAALIPSETSYFERYGLTLERLSRAHKNAIVLHPGPMNRGVEIASEVADSSQSVILSQVNNGIYIRMAVLLELLLSETDKASL